MTNIKFLLTVSIINQGNRLWELIKWSLKAICFDLLTHFFHLYYKIMYGDQSGEFVCGYRNFKKVNRVQQDFTVHNNGTTSMNEMFARVLVIFANWSIIITRNTEIILWKTWFSLRFFFQGDLNKAMRLFECCLVTRLRTSTKSIIIKKIAEQFKIEKLAVEF